MPQAHGRALDVITIGRSSVDLYGQQIGTRLEDVATFAKSVGGCPSNIAIGAARLGLKSAVITRVGDEQMGRYIREQMLREGVETAGIVTDPERLTALVLLSVEDEHGFPLIFYRDNCADMALNEDEIDPAFIASAAAVLVTGTHFSRPGPEAAQRKAMRIARENGGKVVFDIDYRPNLWGLAGHGAGDARYIASAAVSERLKTVLPECDLIVGTEEEVLIAAGESDLLAALKTVRSLSAATIVLKRGPMGCIVYDGPIADDLEAGIVGKGFPIEVYNVLGAGDAFMSGFLRGWLRGEPHATSASWANACGAFAVSRLLCSPESPTFAELEFFLKNGSPHRALRKDASINHVHWATTRRGDWPALTAFAIDHRHQFDTMARENGLDPARIGDFKLLAVEATCRIADGKPGFGMLLDDRLSRRALFEAEKRRLWVGRPVEVPGSRPLRFEENEEPGVRMIEWPATHCVKVLCHFHPDDEAALREEQLTDLQSLFGATRKVGRELMVEIIAGPYGPMDDDTVARAIAQVYDRGIMPDWWKLEPQVSHTAWRNVTEAIATRDAWCRGIVVLGLEAPPEQLEAAFAAATAEPLVKGFAVGRTIWAATAKRWFAGEIDNEVATAEMAAAFGHLVRIWQRLRADVAA